LGIETLVAQADGDRARVQVAGEARRLMMPEEMGEAFKMLALTRDFDAPLPAFAVQDLRDLL
jgi:SAM-dependent MidA family methyltransferase